MDRISLSLIAYRPQREPDTKTYQRSLRPENIMGQAIRMMKYDSNGNMANSVLSPLSLNEAKMVFHRLDDGVMGGKSLTNQEALNTINGILFTGTIDTNGGGFTSIRSPLENSLPSIAKGIKLKVRPFLMENYIIFVTSVISPNNKLCMRSTKVMARRIRYCSAKVTVPAGRGLNHPPGKLI
jgi:hypothetical protein